MRRGDLYRAAPEVFLDRLIADDRRPTTQHRQNGAATDQIGIALVVGVHHDCTVAQDGLRTCGGHRNKVTCALSPLSTAPGVARPFPAIGLNRVTHMPQMAGLAFILGNRLQVAHAGQLHWVPIHHPCIAINQPPVIHALKGRPHGQAEVFVHGECLAVPIDRDAQLLTLIGNYAVRVFLPSPNFLDKVTAAHVAPKLALFGQLLLHHGLSSDAGMIRPRHPQCARAFHPVVARHQILGRSCQGVPHVQCTGHVGRGNRNHELLFIGVQINLTLRLEVAVLFPEFIDAIFHIFRVICFA